MKKLIVVIISLFTLSSFAQNVPDSLKLWKVEGNVTFNFSQVSLTNWAAGGKSSGTGVFLSSVSANYKKDKISWENTAQINYGLYKEKDEDFEKSDDKIDLSSKLGITAKGNWNYAGILGFKSQFAPGYDGDDKTTIISDFLAPGYLNVGFGMDYKTDDFSLLIAPIDGKFTFVMNDDLAADGAFGVDPGKNSRSEIGLYVKMEYKKEIVKNVTFETKLDLFSNYMHNPENIDVDWNVLINMKVNEYLSANINTRLIYDDDVKILDPDTNKSAPRVQFMEMFGVGLTLKF
jgi:hypothetical protein